MSLPWQASAGIVLLAPVSSVAQAAESAAAGARLVDAGRDSALIPAIRRAVSGVCVCGYAETADVVRDAALAARTGAGLMCADAAAAAAAVRHGVAAERIVVQTLPGGIEAASRSGWATLLDLEQGADLEEASPLARTAAIAAMCAWLGVSVIRTRHVAEIRRCTDMTESILGRRPPAWAVRGLA